MVLRFTRTAGRAGVTGPARTAPHPSITPGCCSEDGRLCREQETSALPEPWEPEVPAKALAGLCSLCRLCRSIGSPPFSELLLGAPAYSCISAGSPPVLLASPGCLLMRVSW
ncbi:unnamed protein product [Rangifer tarandus platyrhynchus]|uniref:Uncharacterized protein n=2 Tax=Rangifer tarandus platyrhynchus TaxID=3082113 RepID=A0ACB0FIR9_RANTA|nr:unnamed protein product [Rangifer tarandus platyrhynchus]CAI9712663.1 unnamed protein product [Rangifer tarandus platyrhynchus]